MSDYQIKSMESEQALIGAALLDGSWLTETDLQPSEFLNGDNRTIWAAICEVHKRNEPVDLITVDAELKASGLSWLPYLSEAMRHCASSANWKGYEEALRRHAVAAKSDAILREGLIDLTKGKPVADRVISELMQLDQTGQDYDVSIKQALTESVNLIDRVMKGEEVTVTTGLQCLDRSLGGLHETDLIVIAARPAMGKTAVLLNMLAAVRDPAGLISGEQPREQIGLRLMAIRSGVPIHSVRTGSLNQMQSEQLTQASSDLAQRSVFINDRPGITIQDIRRQARRWKHRHGIKALYVDYIQKIKATDTTTKRHEQVGEVVSALKDLAKELRIPVVALAQVGRQVEARPNKRPHMGDISDSSEIEKEADQIITLYRDEVYNPETYDRGLMELDICKNRHGPTGAELAVWLPDSMRVRDPDQQTRNNWKSRGAA